jgi:hypothetical protein
MDLKGAYYDAVDWIYLMPDRDKWRALLRAVLIL